MRCRGDVIYRARAVILTTGTFLAAIMHTGEAKTPGGRAGEGTTAGISGALHRLGFEVKRFKTGTPPRLNGRTIDFSSMESQPGDDDPEPFSFVTDPLHSPESRRIRCLVTSPTPTQAAHEMIRANLHRAPMYSGQIKSSGPRYCPSSKTKWSGSRRRSGINCSWSRKGGTRRNTT